jgi:hypothetical protein
LPAEASINGSKTNLMKLPPPQSGHSNRAFNLLAGGPPLRLIVGLFPAIPAISEGAHMGPSPLQRLPSKSAALPTTQKGVSVAELVADALL